MKRLLCGIATLCAITTTATAAEPYSPFILWAALQRPGLAVSMVVSRHASPTACIAAGEAFLAASKARGWKADVGGRAWDVLGARCSISGAKEA